MTTNIIEAIQHKLGYPPLQKIDPNVQEVKENAVSTQEARLAQSAIPAVLAGLYRFTESDKGANYILAGGGRESFLETIFEKDKSKAVEKVAHYAGVSPEEAESSMEEIADEAVITIHQAIGEKHNSEKVKEYMSGQRHNILVHLPAAMQLGELLKDDSLDDRTNKMEGPISNLMHKIENSMSKGDEPKYP